MDKQIQEKSLELINFLLKTLQQTKDFTLDQAPAVMQEMINRAIFTHIYSIIIFILIPILAFVIGKYVKNNLDSSDYHYKDARDTATIIPYLLAIMSFIFIVVNTYYLVALLIAPKVYILNTLVDMAK